MKPLVVELFCGRFGWSRGFVAEGYRAVGFDLVHEPYHGDVPEGCSLALQDVLTLHGSQFRDAACIVASPPCQAFSYMAMPWSRAKAKAALIRSGACEECDGTGNFYRHDEDGDFLPCDECQGMGTNDKRHKKLTALFDACFRIQREASEAAGRYIPMVVENVKGAQPWVGMAKAHFGSFYLWGDVESVGGRITVGRFGQSLKPAKSQKFNPDGTAHGQGSWFAVADSKNRGARKNGGGSWFAIGSPGQQNVGQNPGGRKVPGMNFHEFEKTGIPGRSFQSAAVAAVDGVKVASEKGRRTDVGNGVRFTTRDCGVEGTKDGVKQAGLSGPAWFDHGAAAVSSNSPARKAASALIAEIPYDLALHIAQAYKPQENR